MSDGNNYKDQFKWHTKSYMTHTFVNSSVQSWDGAVCPNMEDWGVSFFLQPYLEALYLTGKKKTSVCVCVSCDTQTNNTIYEHN